MKLPRAVLLGLLLQTLCFTLALSIQPWAERQRPEREGGLLPLLLGDGRRLFANHFFAKADAYFHRGVYPSIFDAPRQEEMHMVTAGQETPEHPTQPEEDHDPEHCDDPTHNHESTTPPATDWIANLNQHLLPSAHAHLGGGNEREMLPWLMLATKLDPSNIQTYITTAYWLRTRLQRVDEAEHLLREGLRRNPADPALLYELGVLMLDDRQELDHARNLLELALNHWERREPSRPEPDNVLKEAILARLALIDESQGRLPEAIEWLKQLEPISPQPEAIRKHIEELQAQTTSG